MVYASTGEPRGAEPPRRGEQNPAGAEPTERGEGTDNANGRDGNARDVSKWENDTDATREARIREWLSDENLEWAEGKSLDEILEHFGNELQPIATFPARFLNFLGVNTTDTNLYCCKGYFIDHAVNHHDEEPVEEYLKIQDILNNPTDVKIDTSKERPTLLFIKQYDKYYIEVVSVCNDGTNRIVLHKSFFHRKKMPNKGLPSVAFDESPADEISAISPASKNETAGSSEFSALDDNTSGLSGGKITKSASNKQENGAESSENSEQKGGEGRKTDGEKLEADVDVEGLSWGEDVVSHDNYGRETVHRTMYLDGKPIGTYYGKESGSLLRDGREEYAISVPGLETKQDLMLPLLDADGKDIRDGATGDGARYRLDAGWISFGSKEEAVDFYRRNREAVEKFNESADTEMSHEMRTMAESLVRDKELMKYANGVAFSKPGEESGDATAMGAELVRRIRERLLEMKPDLNTLELMKIGAEFLNEVFSVTNPAIKGKEVHPGIVLPFYDALTGREETTLQRKLERLKARGYEPIGEGEFGPIFDRFKGDAKNAIALLKLLESGEVSGALYHKDVGDIDLVWGVEGTGKSDGYGLAKLLKYHPEVLDNIQLLLAIIAYVSIFQTYNL